MRRYFAWTNSVRGRVTILVTVLFAGVVTAGSWFLITQAERTWINDVQAQDRGELEAIADSLQHVDQITGDIMLPVGTDGTSYSLVDESGSLLGYTPAALFSPGILVEGPETLDSADLIQGDIQLPDSIDSNETASVDLPVEVAGLELTLVATSSLQPVQTAITTLDTAAWVLVPILTAGVAAMTWVVTGIALKPVEAITRKVHQITDSNLDARVPVPSTHDEVNHLAATMNDMLQRLADSRTRQRQFISDASHELRSPIAASRTTLEVALAKKDRSTWQNTATIVLKEQNRLARLVDELTTLARLDEGHSAYHKPVDLSEIVEEEAKTPRRVNPEVTEVETVCVIGNKLQLAQLVRNLIDNAERYSHTQIKVALSSDGSMATLTIDDDGPGIPAQHRHHVFERFYRAEEARDRDSGGSGLGLALVKAIATAHNGTVTAQDSPIGGARLELNLPTYHSRICESSQA